MLTGEIPYGEKIETATSPRAFERLDYAPSYHHHPMVPVWMDRAIETAVAIHPRRRYGVLSELLYDLRHPNPRFQNDTTRPLNERVNGPRRSGDEGVALATLLARALLSFGTHRLMHAVPAFWRIHRVHHLDTELSVSTTLRAHPIEFVIGLAIGAPFALLLGLEPWVLAAYELLDVLVTVFSHSNTGLPVSIERWLRYIIVTPDLHRVHHSGRQPETDSNFGAVLPVWDLVFRTFRTVPSQIQATMSLGLDEARGAAANRLGWLLTSALRPARDEG